MSRMSPSPAVECLHYNTCMRLLESSAASAATATERLNDMNCNAR